MATFFFFFFPLLPVFFAAVADAAAAGSSAAFAAPHSPQLRPHVCDTHVPRQCTDGQLRAAPEAATLRRPARNPVRPRLRPYMSRLLPCIYIQACDMNGKFLTHSPLAAQPAHAGGCSASSHEGLGYSASVETRTPSACRGGALGWLVEEAAPQLG